MSKKASSLLVVFASSLYINNAMGGFIETSFAFYDLNIAETNVADALNQLAQQSNTVLLYPFSDLKEKHAHAVVGRYNLEQALNILLAGSGYTGSVLRSGTIKITQLIKVASDETTDSDIAISKGVTENSEEVEVIKVTGITWGIKRSLVKKHYSDQIIDVLSDEDIGKFPDQNIAEALQRISGISIDRVDGGAPQVWFTFDPFAYAEYLWSTVFLDANFGDDPERRAELQLLKETGNPYPHYDRNSTYSVNEQVVESYIKLDLDTEIGGMPLTGNLGVRYAQTDVKSTGYDSVLFDISQEPSDPTLLKLDFTDPQIVSVSHDYSNVMPSINLKLDVTDEQVVRFSSSKTLSRPTLSRLGVGLNGYNGRLGASSASGGNPKLEPFVSTNYDLSWNWYYDEASYVGITAFMKKADNFLSQTTEVENLLPGNQYGEFLVTRARNTASATVSGYEFALLHTFTNGFGLQANYTLVESDDDFDAITNPSAFALEGLSNSANFIAFYEKDGIQARLAYNWRDEYLSRAVGAQTQAEMVEAYGQVDMSASYDFSEHTTLFFEGINITDEATRSFSIFKERLLNYAETGRRVSLGFRVSF